MDTTPRIEERSIEIDELRFQGLQILSPENTKTITNYQYEYNYNERKENIVLIEDIYAERITTKFERIIWKKCLTIMIHLFIQAQIDFQIHLEIQYQ